MSIQLQDGANIFNINSGNVGIGTATPTRKLQVAGYAQASRFYNNVGAYFGYDADENMLYSPNAVRRLSFYTDGTERFGILPTGSLYQTVLTDPTKVLYATASGVIRDTTVATNSEFHHKIQTASANGGGNLTATNDSVDWVIVSDGTNEIDNIIGFSTSPFLYITFAPSDTETVFISNSGNIGLAGNSTRDTIHGPLREVFTVRWDADSSRYIEVPNLSTMYNFPFSAGNTGEVLTTDGAGNVTWGIGGSGGGTDTTYAHIKAIRPNMADTLFSSTNIDCFNNTSLFPNGTEFHFYDIQCTATESIRNANCTYYTYGIVTFTKTNTGFLFVPNKYTNDFRFVGDGTTFMCTYGILSYDTLYSISKEFYLRFNVANCDSTDAFKIHGYVYKVDVEGDVYNSGTTGYSTGKNYNLYLKSVNPTGLNHITINNSNLYNETGGNIYCNASTSGNPIITIGADVVILNETITEWCLEAPCEANLEDLATYTTNWNSGYPGGEGAGKVIKVGGGAGAFVGLHGIYPGNVELYVKNATLNGTYYNTLLTLSGDNCSIQGVLYQTSIANSIDTLVVNGKWNGYKLTSVSSWLACPFAIDCVVGAVFLNATCSFNVPSTDSHVPFINQQTSSLIDIKGDVLINGGAAGMSYYRTFYNHGILKIRGRVVSNVDFAAEMIYNDVSSAKNYLYGGELVNNSAQAGANGMNFAQSGTFYHDGGRIVVNSSSSSIVVPTTKTVTIRNYNNYFTNYARSGAGTFTETITGGGTEIVDTDVE